MLSTLILAAALPSFAGTADGFTPAEELVCDGYTGASFGLCVAYCEATDCDSDAPNASDQACDRLFERFVDVTGETPPCEVTEYEVEIRYTGDDTVYPSLNGAALPSQSGDTAWSSASSQTVTLTSGTAVLGFHVVDVARVVHGLNVAVLVDGQPYLLSGTDNILATTSAPAAGWDTDGFVTSGWFSAPTCTTTAWGTYPTSLSSIGAEWIGATSSCYASGGEQTWFRAELVLP